MKFLRIGFIHRFISIFLLLVFIQPIASPYYLFALTSGAHQPEFTSYEDGASADMVNLLTGDFTFNLPVLDVPGPEGNFSLPLSYHAGISPEQEASWVGLGFNINAGSIVRDINQYPDDASGEPNYVTVQDLTGIAGWNKVYNHPFKDDWNSQTGYHGNINLLDIVEVDFGDQGTNVGVIGVHVGDDGVTFDPVQFTSAVITIASWGIGGAAASAASIAKDAAIGMAVSSATSFAMPTNTPGAPTSGSYKYSKQNLGTTFKFNDNARLSFLLGLPIHSRKKSWKIFLDQTRAEEMYGILNLGKPQLLTYGNGNVSINGGADQSLNSFSHSIWILQTEYSSSGAASDINFTLNGNQDFASQQTATVLATDSYSVNAAGINGSISPYRLDIGSVSMPRKMTEGQSRFAPLPYLDYKVPFIYEGSLSNGYSNHMGGLNSVSSAFYYGLDLDVQTKGTVISTPSGPAPVYWPFYHYKLNDLIFAERIPQAIDEIKKIRQGNNTEWLTNGEIRSDIKTTDQIAPLGFIDFLSAVDSNYPTSNDYKQSDRYKFRSNFTTLGSSPFPETFSLSSENFSNVIPINDQSVLTHLNSGSAIQVTLWDRGSNANISFATTVSSKNTSGMSITIYVPGDIDLSFFNGKPVNMSISYSVTPQSTNPQLQSGIGGFSITSVSGVTYHFALPVYEYDRKSESILISDNNKRSIITRTPAFASSWLLTSITGPDFVDRNTNGLADDGDWGYWVKMNYGKHADAFNWRMPYGTSDTDTYMTDISGTYKSYERGKKQLYYLNSIETRSHVALFMKSSREDGKSATSTQPINPLKLDEICLLQKEHYKKLGSTYGIDYTNKISALCLSSEYTNSAHNNIRDYVNKNCMKRVIFNYDYTLCPATPNAGGTNNAQQGKLTLKGISIKGRNDIKTVPDYKFEYANNPGYNVNSWDGWGMYNAFGGSSSSSHKVNDAAGSMGSAWSLTKVSTPLGSNILINYERDTYSTISGEALFENSVSFTNSNIKYYYPIDLPIKKLWINHNGYFAVGDKVSISGDATYKCPNDAFNSSKTYSATCNVTEVGTNYIKVAEDYMGLGTCGAINSGTTIDVQSQSGTATKIIYHKTGGNIRVGSIVMRDEFGKENKLRYLYTNDDGSSSGIVAQEPEYIRTQHFPFYDYLKYPQTPVMYGKVSVLSGKLLNDTDFHSKQVFSFETPNKNLLNLVKESISTPSNGNLFKIEDRTSKIGALKSVEIFSKSGMVSKSQMVYTDKILNEGVDNKQGVFTEGTLLTDVLGWGFKNTRTTVITYPYTLKKVINSKDGLTSTSEYFSWDLLTGAVTQKLDKSALGIYVKTVSKPAYTVLAYAELGSKADNINYKNMLMQNAATYVYRSDPMGRSLDLISAEAQTWRKNWTKYRFYNTLTSRYEDEDTQANQIWRKGAAYTWRGEYSRLDPKYGTQNFAVGDEFNFTGANPSWQYLGEIKRFDHYGMPLESVDLNESDNSKAIYSSVKMGYDNRLIIASASNARFNEIAFSSAEDKNLSVPVTYFGGEVSLGSGTQVTVPVHTGKSSLSVPASAYGFTFRASELSASKNYKASVWSNSPNGKIYYKVVTNNLPGSEIIPPQTVSAPIVIPGNGTWYRIDMELKNPTSSTIDVGVKAVDGLFYFDDFRFQPADAVMTCYVYPPLEFEFSIAAPAYSPAYVYTLDNDNLFTKQEVNEKGELVKVYAESFMYGVKLISESKSNLRGFNISQ